MEKKKIYNIPVFIPHNGCPNDCVFCNQKKITGVQTSVTPQMAESIIKDYLNFIPKGENHIEIAFFGGSFTGLTLDMQEEFLKVADRYRAVTGGIRMSTRPDYINRQVLELAKKYNVRTIELGLQSSDDRVLALNGRGHIFKDTVNASALIKEFGIDLGLQMMVGMYGSSPELDIQTATDTASLNPKCVRIYPTLTLKGTKLEELYSEGRYTPYNMDTAIDITDKVMRIFEDKNIEIIRVGLHSDESLTSDSIVAGPYHPAFKELVLSKRQRDIIEKEVLALGIKDCSYTAEVPLNLVSPTIGHHRENVIYFKENYNIELKVKGFEKTPHQSADADSFPSRGSQK